MAKNSTDSIEKITKRAADFAAIYVAALNKVQVAVEEVNQSLAGRTVFPGAGSQTLKPIETVSKEVLQMDLSDSDFETRLALERKQVDVTLQEFAFSMKALGEMMNRGYKELASDFDPQVQQALITAKMKPWQRWIPFYSGMLARKQIRLHFDRSPVMSANRMMELYSMFLTDSKKKSR